MLGLLALFVSVSSSYPTVAPVLPEVQAYMYAQEVNITRDDSITRYVWPHDPLTTPRYKPADLVDLTDAAFIRVQGWIGQLRQEAFTELADMAFHFFRVFRKELVVVSSYRSYGLQKSLFEWYIESHGLAAAATFSALPWRSEHQLWLAVDLFTANDVDALGYTGYYDRMRQNAHKRWRTQSYQKWASVDGYIIEPRHWRYVGKRLATELFEKKLTFSEWVEKYKR